MINLRKESEEKQVLAPIIDMEFLKVETKWGFILKGNGKLFNILFLIKESKCERLQMIQFFSFGHHVI
jgi:hypothetical protein